MNTNTKHPAQDMKPPDRFAFLLHLSSSSGQWRASLEDLERGKRLGFSNLEHLFAHLMDLTENSLKRRPDPDAAKQATDESRKGM
ncbi:MAG TPA: hypothetical protein VK897_11210 [Anaerolineales bacterium]|nr:hypothetical protein [Anaerolineales bacterium]